MPKAAFRIAASLFDHLVGDREHRRRDFQAERLGSLDVEYKLEGSRLLYGQHDPCGPQNSRDLRVSWSSFI